MGIEEYYKTYWQDTGYLGATRLGAGLERVLDRWVQDEASAIDVGCGDGGSTGDWLMSRTSSYVGVDISAVAITASRARGLDARLIEDAAALPFEGERFDLAVCIEVLEHLFEPAAAVAEIHRVLRPGGSLIVTVPNVAHWRSRVDLAFLGRWAGHGDARSAAAPWLDPHIRFFTLRAMRRLLASEGFEVVDNGAFTDLGLLQSVPGLRSLMRDPAAGIVANRLADSFPGIFGLHLYAVGRKLSPTQAAADIAASSSATPA